MVDEAPTALDMLTVVELSEGVSGPFATKLLADYGARVVKVERPGVGDGSRGHGPFPGDVPHRERSALFLYLNTNKESITLDYETPTGAALLRRLLEDADALVEDHPTRRRADLGLDADSLIGIAPRLVITQLSAYGSTGPYSDRPYTNLTAYASGGQMSMCGDPDREPLLAGGYQAEYQAGLHAYAATLGALWHAAQTEHGQVVDVGGMEAMATTLEISLSSYLYRHRPAAEPPPQDFMVVRRGNQQSATIGLYPCADGWVGVHAMARQVPALLAMVGVEDTSLGRERLRRNDELLAQIFAWAADKTKHEAYRLAGEFNAPLAYALDVKDVVESEHLRYRDFIRDIGHPEAGRLKYPRGPFVMAETPWVEGRAPLLGEHNEKVFRDDLGLDARDLARLRAAGVV